IRRDAAARSKTPRALVEHAHAEPETLTTRNVLHLLLARPDRLVAITIDANVCVSDTEFFSGVQRDVGERVLIDAVFGGFFRGGDARNPGGQGSERYSSGRNSGRLQKVTTRGGHGNASLEWW